MDYSYYAFQLEAERRSLLVFAYRQDIIESAKINPTTIIVGEKGSEKQLKLPNTYQNPTIFYSFISDR